MNIHIQHQLSTPKDFSIGNWQSGNPAINPRFMESLQTENRARIGTMNLVAADVRRRKVVA